MVAITTDLKAWQPNELTMALDACEAVVDTSANDVDVQVLGQYILREASVDINGDPVDADVGDGALIAQTGIDVDNPSADCRASD